ncbi:MAG: 50S ribosomal protein L21 [Dehalococcoidales bacterium]
MSSGGVTIYAIIETGGKQYKVSPGESLKVESLDVAEGGTIELDRVLAISDGDKLVLGKPLIEGARVSCTSKGDGRGVKVFGMKYKAKTRYSRRIGHRQSFTELTIDSISGPGIAEAPKAKKAKAEKAPTPAEESTEKPATKPRRRMTKKEVKENGS